MQEILTLEGIDKVAIVLRVKKKLMEKNALSAKNKYFFWVWAPDTVFSTVMFLREVFKLNSWETGHCKCEHLHKTY